MFSPSLLASPFQEQAAVFNCVCSSNPCSDLSCHCLQGLSQSHCCELLSQQFINSSSFGLFLCFFFVFFFCSLPYLPPKVKVTCMGKYSWETAMDLEAITFLPFIECKSTSLICVNYLESLKTICPQLS